MKGEKEGSEKQQVKKTTTTAETGGGLCGSAVQTTFRQAGRQITRKLSLDFVKTCKVIGVVTWARRNERKKGTHWT